MAMSRLLVSNTITVLCTNACSLAKGLTNFWLVVFFVLFATFWWQCNLITGLASLKCKNYKKLSYQVPFLISVWRLASPQCLLLVFWSTGWNRRHQDIKICKLKIVCQVAFMWCRVQKLLAMLLGCNCVKRSLYTIIANLSTIEVIISFYVFF